MNTIAASTTGNMDRRRSERTTHRLSVRRFRKFKSVIRHHKHTYNRKKTHIQQQLHRILGLGDKQKTKKKQMLKKIREVKSLLCISTHTSHKQLLHTYANFIVGTAIVAEKANEKIPVVIIR